MSIFALQSLLGHIYVETTLNYARLYDDNAAKQFLEASTPIQLSSVCADAEQQVLASQPVLELSKFGKQDSLLFGEAAHESR